VTRFLHLFKLTLYQVKKPNSQKNLKKKKPPLFCFSTNGSKFLELSLERYFSALTFRSTSNCKQKRFLCLSSLCSCIRLGRASQIKRKSELQLFFSNLIYHLNFDNIQEARQALKSAINTKDNLRNSVWTREHTETWEDDMEGFAQLCQGAIITITDIFIQYASSASAQPHLKPDQESYNI
jgi:hypothetical protein